MYRYCLWLLRALETDFAKENSQIDPYVTASMDVCTRCRNRISRHRKNNGKDLIWKFIATDIAELKLLY